MDGLEEQYQDQIAFQHIDANTGEGPAIVRTYQIAGHPTILLYDNEGQEVNRLLGPQTVEALEQALQQILP